MTATTTRPALADRVDALDWDALEAVLDEQGFAITEPLLAEDECAALAALFDGEGFRSTIDMARHRFGDGRYRYFDHPLPAAIAELRGALYRHLAPVANRWAELLSGGNPTFPLEHDELLERCRAAGQERPTPLILRYGAGDWNALHQDLYGDVFFPFQALTASPTSTRAASSSCSSSARARRAARTSCGRRAARSCCSRPASGRRAGAGAATAPACATGSRR
jgi:hypothetical protein